MTEEKSHGSDSAASSSMVGIRTTVMIVFLVSIPLLAVVGTGFPDSIRCAVESGGASIFSSRSTSKEASPPETSTASASPQPTGLVEDDPAAAAEGRSNPAAQQAQADALTSSEQPSGNPRAVVTGVRVPSNGPRARIIAVRGLPDGPQPPPTAPLWAPSPRTASSSAGRQTTAHFEPSPRREPPQGAQSRAMKRVGAESLQATAYSTPPTNAGGDAAAEATAEHDTASSADVLARSEQRLRELGAEHYRLETWGESGRLFRCTARVVLPGRRRGLRHFSAVAAGPAQAVDDLLQQVEDWRVAQR